MGPILRGESLLEKGMVDHRAFGALIGYSPIS